MADILRRFGDLAVSEAITKKKIAANEPFPSFVDVSVEQLKSA